MRGFVKGGRNIKVFIALFHYVSGVSEIKCNVLVRELLPHIKRVSY
jgi:hypothetical protein